MDGLEQLLDAVALGVVEVAEEIGLGQRRQVVLGEYPR